MYFNNMNCLIHVIQEGDTLYSLGRRFNIPLSALFKANPYVDVYNLQIGEELCIPVLQMDPPIDFYTYVIEEGDTLEDVLERFNINLEELLEFNNLSDQLLNRELSPGVSIQIPMYQ